jgi:predicted phage terminase large subunit-like protein
MPEIVLSLPELHQAQQQILAESRRFNVCCLGRRTGKTFMGSDILIDGPRKKGALHGYPVAWYAPTYPLMLEVWRKLAVLLKPVTTTKSEQNKRLDLIGGGAIEFWSLDNPDAGRGRKYATVVVDEAAMVRNLDDAFENNIRPLLADFKGEFWAMSTPKGNNYFQTLFERGVAGSAQRDPEWASFQMPTWVNPYIPKEEIEAMRRGMPRLSFLQEIEAQFVSFAGTFIKAEHIRTGQPPENMRLYQGVDLAISMKENADYTAIVTMGIDESGRVWIVDAERRRVGFRDTLAFIREKAARWHPVSIAIETVQYQAAVCEELLRSTDLPVRQVRPDKDKLTRAQGLITRYENGMVWHAETLPRYFTEELLSFGPDAEHDDLVDSAVYAYLQTGDWGKTQIFLPESPSAALAIQRVKSAEMNMPGLPSGVMGMLSSAPDGACGRCVSFADGACTERRVSVGVRDPGCDMFIGREST